MHRVSPLALACAIGAAVAVLAGPAGAEDPAPPRRPEDMLAEAQRRLRRREEAAAVALLRELVTTHPRTTASKQGRALLARQGFGLNFRVRFEAERNLHRLEFREEEVVGRVETILEALDVFFRQTLDVDPATARPEFEVIVFDSRAGFREAHPRTVRRSMLVMAADGPAARGEGAGRRPERSSARIAVYHDSRLRNRRDSVDLLEKGIARETACLLARTYGRRRLPAALETGLCEYLAARLFPRKLDGLGQTPEGILRSFAREGAARIDGLPRFEEHLRGTSPEGRVTPVLYWQWAGVSYAVFDLLAAGGGADEDLDDDPAAGLLERAARVGAFQSLLRELDVLASEGAEDADPLPLLERVLERHFEITVEELHRRLLARARRYPPMEPDFEGITD